VRGKSSIIWIRFSTSWIRFKKPQLISACSIDIFEEGCFSETGAYCLTWPRLPRASELKSYPSPSDPRARDRVDDPTAPRSSSFIPKDWSHSCRALAKRNDYVCASIELNSACSSFIHLFLLISAMKDSIWSQGKRHSIFNRWPRPAASQHTWLPTVSGVLCKQCTKRMP
jgi:hypothetical protein